MVRAHFASGEQLRKVGKMFTKHSRYLAMMLIVALLLGAAVPAGAAAADQAEGDVRKENGFYFYEAAMYPQNFEGSDQMPEKGAVIAWMDYNNEPDVVFPAELGGLPVVAICDVGLLGCPYLQSITFPDSVLYMDASFRNTSIKEIELPANLIWLGGISMFEHDSLEEVPLPDSLQYIGENAFAHNEYLKELHLPSQLTEICDDAFSWCVDLADVEWAPHLKNIGEGAFIRTNLREVYLPDSVRSIGTNAFAACTNLEKISLPRSLEQIGKYAFRASSTEVIDYRGTVEEWRRIEGHDLAGDHIIRCTDGLVPQLLPAEHTERSLGDREKIDWGAEDLTQYATQWKHGDISSLEAEQYVKTPVVNSVVRTIAGRIEAPVNSMRLEAGRQALQCSELMNRAAAVRALEMAATGDAGHERPDGSSFDTLLYGDDSGVTFGYEGMEITFSTPDHLLENSIVLESCPAEDVAVKAMETWKNTSRDYANMMMPDASYMGIAAAQDQQGRWYVCQLIAPWFAHARLDGPCVDPETMRSAVRMPYDDPSRAVPLPKQEASSAEEQAIGSLEGFPRFDLNEISIDGLMLDTSMETPVICGLAMGTTVRDIEDAVHVGERKKLWIADIHGIVRREALAPVATGDDLSIIPADLVIFQQDAVTNTGICLAVRGDVLGTGEKSLSQLVRLSKAYTGAAPIDGVLLLAADVNGDGEFGLSDLVAAAKEYSI